MLVIYFYVLEVVIYGFVLFVFFSVLDNLLVCKMFFNVYLKKNVDYFKDIIFFLWLIFNWVLCNKGLYFVFNGFIM